MASMLTVVYYGLPTTEIMVYDTKFYGQPILQASGVQDVTGLPAGSTCQPAQAMIDGVGTSYYCPVYVYNRSGRRHQLTQRHGRAGVCQRR